MVDLLRYGTCGYGIPSINDGYVSGWGTVFFDGVNN
jgi:hypothetical protein